MKEKKRNTTVESTELMPVLQAKTLEQIRRQSHGFITLMSYYKCAMMEVETKDVIYSCRGYEPMGITHSHRTTSLIALSMA